MADASSTCESDRRQSRRFGNKNGLVHGESIGQKTSAEYNAWKGMRHRCYRPNHPRYSEYGGRGIRVHETWRADFSAFLTDMGRKPSAAHSLDRIDVNGDYEPGNCRWATQKEQCRNQRRNRLVSYCGEKMTLAEFAEIVGIDRSHLRYHLDKGRSAEEAVLLIHANRDALLAGEG